MMKIENIFEYLKKKISNFEKTRKINGQFCFTCPREGTAHKIKSSYPTCTTKSGSDQLECLICGWKGNVYDLIREVEKKPMTDEEVISLLGNETKIDLYPELEEYKKYGWSLLPIAKNGKIPLEKGWTEQTHKEKSEWIKWIEQGLNVGVRTGDASGITVIDADLKVAPNGEFEEIYKMLTEAKTLSQNSPKGKHFIFKYDKDLKQTSKVAGVTIDIRNDGGQFLVAPSKINVSSYNWVNLGAEIKEIPENVKVKLLNIEKVEKSRIEENPKMVEEIKQISEGGRNDSLVSLGGLFSKHLSIEQTELVLSVINQKFINPPLPTTEIRAMLGSLDSYKRSEAQTQYDKVYECCELLELDITSAEVERHTELKKNIVNKILSQLHKDGKLIRKKQGRYDLREEVQWTNELSPKLKLVNFEVPYFSNIAYFRESDMIILGAFSGSGKTTIAVNMIKQLKSQGIVPYYISLESGSRHEITREKLGMSHKDYYVSKNPVLNPAHISLQENAVTIIDWLNLGEDFAATPIVFKHLSDEMRIKKGFLIVFTQTRENGGWFAPDLINQFARFSAIFRLMDEKGTNGYFDIDKITEPKGEYRKETIQTEFNFETKELKLKNNL